MEEENKIEVYLAILAMWLAIFNILLTLFPTNFNFFIKPFSIALSVLIFYYGWKTVKETEFYHRIKMLMLLFYLEREAKKKARRILKNVK